MTHGISESTFTRTPLASWKVAVPEWVDVVGISLLLLGKDLLLVVSLACYGDGRDDATGEEHQGGEE